MLCRKTFGYWWRKELRKRKAEYKEMKRYSGCCLYRSRTSASATPHLSMPPLKGWCPPNTLHSPSRILKHFWHMNNLPRQQPFWQGHFATNLTCAVSLGRSQIFLILHSCPWWRWTDDVPQWWSPDICVSFGRDDSQVEKKRGRGKGSSKCQLMHLLELCWAAGSWQEFRSQLCGVTLEEEFEPRLDTQRFLNSNAVSAQSPGNRNTDKVFWRVLVTQLRIQAFPNDGSFPSIQLHRSPPPAILWSDGRGGSVNLETAPCCRNGFPNSIATSSAFENVSWVEMFVQNKRKISRSEPESKEISRRLSYYRLEDNCFALFFLWGGVEGCNFFC